MAGHVLFNSYGEYTGNDSKINSSTSNIYPYSGGAGLSGTAKSVASGGTVFTAISPAITVGSATCNAIVEVLPTGLQTHGKKYLTDSTAATLNTGAA
jgi:hypothetical protein